MSLEVSSSLSSSSCCLRSVFCSSSERRSLSNCWSSSCGNRIGDTNLSEWVSDKSQRASRRNKIERSLCPHQSFTCRWNRSCPWPVKLYTFYRRPSYILIGIHNVLHLWSSWVIQVIRYLTETSRRQLYLFLVKKMLSQVMLNQRDVKLFNFFNFCLAHNQWKAFQTTVKGKCQPFYTFRCVNRSCVVLLHMWKSTIKPSVTPEEGACNLIQILIQWCH